MSGEADESAEFVDALWRAEQRVRVVLESYANDNAIASPVFEKLAYNVMNTIALNPLLSFHGKADVDAIWKFHKALDVVQNPDFSDGLEEVLRLQIAQIGWHHQDLENGLESNFRTDVSKESIDRIKELFRIRNEIADDMVPFLNAMLDVVENEPPAGQKNYQAINAVEGARVAWKHIQGRDAPAKSLNPASRFGMFLADILDAAEIEADPRSAFNAWVRECARSESA